jgi:UPF0755 protein
VDREQSMEIGQTPPSPPPTRLTARSKRWMAFWTFICLILFMAGGAGGVLLYAAHSLQPTEPGEPVRFTVPSGVSSSRIASILEKNGLIRDAMTFAYYLKLKDIGRGFQAGEYEMAPGTELSRIIEMLNNGETVPPEMIRFTIPEGWTVEKIATLIADTAGLDREEILDLARHPEKLKATEGKAMPAFVGALADREGLTYKLEGYLFPETYEMLADSSANDIVFRLVRQLGDRLARLPEGWETKLQESGLSFHEILTVASLIEREVVLDEERPIVASVIYNRLAKKMNLEIDATVQYALEEHKERLLYDDLEVDSPYNTYKNAGLPPGPIASPGLKSIEAALFPAETKYLFYVTKKDGSGGHLFAETFKEHQRNISISNETAKNAGEQ